MNPSPCTLPEARKTGYTTDATTGKVKVVTDLDNSSTATVMGYDPFGRPNSVTDAAGGTTSITYQDSSLYQKTTPPLNIGVSATCFDRLGRTILKQTSENGTLTPCSPSSSGTVISVSMEYQYVASGSGGGRYEWISNPVGGVGQSAAGWTRKRFDSTGRIVEEASFSGSATPTYTAVPDLGKITYTYNGPCHTVQDQAENASPGTGAVRTTCLDAAGRISSVTETIAGTTPITNYIYDVQDNLRTVTQGSQTRTFNYDPLGRLTSATNPEGGTVSYVYDDNGNLIEKRDPRPLRDMSGSPIPNSYISTCYGSVSGTQCATNVAYSSSIGYDGLNRVRFKAYTDGTPPNYTDRTPSVTYTYDQDLSGGAANYARGRLVSVLSGGTTVQYNQFDAVGRIRKHTQISGTATYPPFTYVYNAAGLLTQVTYPSGRVLTTNYDGAGRVAGLQGLKGTSTTNYAGTPAGQDIKYWAHGGIFQMKLGNQGTALTEQWTYNSRLQPIAITLGTSAGSGSVRGLTLDYGGTGNNGNLASQTISGAGLSANAVQTYQYDRLNRIQSAGEGSAWNRSFGADRYGNGWVTSSSGIAPSSFTPTSSGFYDAFNRLNILGAVYDEAGNQKQAGSSVFAYDAENRMTSSTLNFTTVYQYDGEGRRVAKVNCPAGMNTCDPATSGVGITWYVYDAFGEVAAEYSNNALTQPCTTCFLMADQLGSTRVVMDQNGQPVECHDYLPFGEEIPGGIGGRSGCYASNPGSGRLFTGKERDAETQGSAMPSGLDYFGARYFSGTMGRFTTPDPVIATDKRLRDPQQFNLYAYARGNPLRFVDPTGEVLQTSGDLHQVETDLCLVLGVDDCRGRITRDEKTSVVTIDFTGIDVKNNEGAKLLSDITSSTSVYDLSYGRTVNTAGGPVDVVTIRNLDRNPDWRYGTGKKPTDQPRGGIDDEIALNPAAWNHAVSENLLLPAPRSSVAFHELAEAFAKIDKGMQYVQQGQGMLSGAHGDAVLREQRLRDQRPYLYHFNYGSGPGTNYEFVIRK